MREALYRVEQGCASALAILREEDRAEGAGVAVS
jgi:hypothetical protein